MTADAASSVNSSGETKGSNASCGVPDSSTATEETVPLFSGLAFSTCRSRKKMHRCAAEGWRRGASYYRHYKGARVTPLPKKCARLELQIRISKLEIRKS